MHLPRGQPPGYQRAAWAAAGLRAPPDETIGVHTNAGFTEGFQIGAAAATLEASRKDAAHVEATMAALHQAAESHKMAQHAINLLQTQAHAYQHMQQTIEQLRGRVYTLENMVADLLNDPSKKGKGAGPAQPFRESMEEPLSKRLRALNWKNSSK